MDNFLNKNDFLKIGILKKPHGISGDISIRLLPEFNGIKINPTWLFIEIDGEIVPFEVLFFKEKGIETIVVKLETIDTEGSARKYQNLPVYIKSDEIIKTNKKDIDKTDCLLGYSVFDKKHGNIGIIRNIIEIQQNPLMEIVLNEQEILFPYQKNFIISVDKKNGILNIDAPDGLIELFIKGTPKNLQTRRYAPSLKLRLSESNVMLA